MLIPSPCRHRPSSHERNPTVRHRRERSCRCRSRPSATAAAGSGRNVADVSANTPDTPLLERCRRSPYKGGKKLHEGEADFRAISVRGDDDGGEAIRYIMRAARESTPRRQFLPDRLHSFTPASASPRSDRMMRGKRSVDENDEARPLRSRATGVTMGSAKVRAPRVRACVR